MKTNKESIPSIIEQFIRGIVRREERKVKTQIKKPKYTKMNDIPILPEDHLGCPPLRIIVGQNPDKTKGQWFSCEHSTGDPEMEYFHVSVVRELLKGVKG